MSELGPDDFPAFFEAVHGYSPFPWQTRLAKQVVTTGLWPALLDLPTGTGKTAAIDIAVFHLACEADRGPARCAPLRILFVIDRRIVVDAAAERAKTIAAALTDRDKLAKHPVLAVLAGQLSLLSGCPQHPLDVVRLRGGAPEERDWARSPAQPLVAVSTVDQVGSRLLFRGYGVSARMAPVHAGLVGADALWLLDEVHLSMPLEETLDAIRDGHLAKDGKGGALAREKRLAPFAVVKLSATPGEKQGGETPFRLSGEDRQHHRLRPRLFASKITTLGTIGGKPGAAFAKYALEFMEDREKRYKRIAVIVNRVDLARAVFERILKDAGAPDDEDRRADVLLLTGRIRPLDRERILNKLKACGLFAECERAASKRPVILVATQTVEAGADLDFDALVTEIAPLDVLRQRFGRLDRLGQNGKSCAVILSPKGKPAAKENEWAPIVRIYGDAAYETRNWLEEHGKEIDFGTDAFQQRLNKLAAAPDKLKRLLAPRAQAPVLLPAYADLWSTTSPAPMATPEPALFLHGRGISPDMHIVWRADIDPKRGAARTSLKFCPPSTLEAMPVPVWAARRWLHKKEDAAFADVPERAPDGRRELEGLGKSFMRLERSEDGERFWKWSRDPARLRPGDTIIVPCNADYGGCDEWGWNPGSEAEVTDLGAEAHYRQRRKGALRITRATLENALRREERSKETDEAWQVITAAVSDEGEPEAADVCDALLAVPDLPDQWMRLARAIGGRTPQIRAFDENNNLEEGFVLYSAGRLNAGLLGTAAGEEDEPPGEAPVTARRDSWRIGREISLTDHARHVCDKVSEFAHRAGLNAHMTKMVALAAKLHDLGKADPRFQADLRSETALIRANPELAALLASSGKELLAKGKRKGGWPQRVRSAPDGFRHEALSVALAAQHREVKDLQDEDRYLVLWLIGTHHGYGRPFFPPPDDHAPGTDAQVEIDGQRLLAKACDAPIRLDQGWFELAERVRRRFGPWELARLEAILRLADHAASAEEERTPSDQAAESTATASPEAAS